VDADLSGSNSAISGWGSREKMQEEGSDINLKKMFMEEMEFGHNPKRECMMMMVCEQRRLADDGTNCRPRTSERAFITT